MRVFVITEEQINKLYLTVTAGSRNWERLIQEVKSQEVSWEDVARFIRSHEEKVKDTRRDPGNQSAETKKVSGPDQKKQTERNL